MKHEDLSSALGLSRGAMSDRLRGRTKFDVDELDAVAEFFAVRVEYVLGLSEARDNEDPIQSLMRRVGDAGRSRVEVGDLFEAFRNAENPRPGDPDGGDLYGIADSNREPAGLNAEELLATVTHLPRRRHVVGSALAREGRVLAFRMGRPA